MTPRISVVAAVRERVGLLGTMLDSLIATAADMSRVEVVLRCDFDDANMISCLGGMARYKFIVGPRERGYASLPAFANEAARLSTGDLVLVVNDDAVFSTPGWDTRLVEAASEYPDGIFVLGVEVENADNFVFPCVSRRQVNLFGGVFDERLVYPDIWLRDVMRQFDRAIRVPEVVINHRWAGLSEDQQRAVQQGQDGALYEQCVRDGVEKIKDSYRRSTCIVHSVNLASVGAAK